MIDLNQLLREQKYTRETPGQERRSSERHSLDFAPGEFSYRGHRFPCKLVNVSMDGCCIVTQRHFAGGSLAQVSVLLPVCGMELRLGGTTIWTNDDNRIGIRFVHPTAQSRNQLAGLISCLMDRVAADAVQSTVGSAASVAAAEANAAIARPGDLVSPEQIAAADKAVHGESERVRSYVPGEWPAVLRSTALKLHATGALTDVSLSGCIFRANKPFACDTNAAVEIEFEIRALHFRLAGTAAALYNALTAGVRFDALVPRKREELAQLLEELSGVGNTGPHIASHRGFAEEREAPTRFDGKEEDIDDWDDIHITFRD